MSKLINIFSKKALEQHDAEIRFEGMKEANQKATELWQQEFQKQIEDEKINRFKAMKDIKDIVLNIEVINSSKKYLKDEKKTKIAEEIEKLLEIIDRDV